MSLNKSFSTETSERYSRALFELSKEENDLDKNQNDIKKFQILYDNCLDLKILFKTLLKILKSK